VCTLVTMIMALSIIDFKLSNTRQHWKDIQNIFVKHKWKHFCSLKFYFVVNWLKQYNTLWHIYDNEYTSIIDIYLYETFSTRTSSISTLKHFLDTLSGILDKCLHFSLIKIDSVSIFTSKATLGPILSSVVYTFRLKMLSLVLIKNCNLCVC
jgi:hypothetical protein